MAPKKGSDNMPSSSRSALRIVRGSGKIQYNSLPPISMQVAASDVLTFLLILAAIMLVVVLYHLIFIVVRARRITERADDITAQVENILMKPLRIAEESMTWITEFMLNMYEDHKKDKRHHKK